MVRVVVLGMVLGEDLLHARITLVDGEIRWLRREPEQRHPDIVRQVEFFDLAVAADVGADDVRLGGEELVGGVRLAGIAGTSSVLFAASDKPKGLQRLRLLVLLGLCVMGGNHGAGWHSGQDRSRSSEHDAPRDKAIHGVRSSTRNDTPPREPPDTASARQADGFRGGPSPDTRPGEPPLPASEAGRWLPRPTVVGQHHPRRRAHPLYSRGQNIHCPCQIEQN
jgi:hypothetical protein